MNLPDFNAYCRDACIKLWGEPDKTTSKKLTWNGGGNSYGWRTFDVAKRVWYDGDAKRGGGLLDLAVYAKGEPEEKVRGAKVFDCWRYCYEQKWFPEPPPAEPKSDLPIRATYPYQNEDRVLLFEVVRASTQPIRRNGLGSGDRMATAVGFGRSRARASWLYRLPEFIAAVKNSQRVLVCEGEKDSNSAVKLGYPATCNPGGVGKWRREFDEFFRGADVVVVSDNDQQLKDPKTGVPMFHPDGRPMLPGQDHAAAVARRLSKVAAHVRTIIFPQKDLSEWVAAGGTREAPADEPPAQSCQLFLEFLQRMTAGSEKLQDFLQRVCGYCLTGLTIGAEQPRVGVPLRRGRCLTTIGTR
jgi:hypothetical protein